MKTTRNPPSQYPESNSDINKRQIAESEESKKLREKYIILRRRMKTAQEAKPLPTENIKDKQAIAYFQNNRDHIQRKIDDIEDSLKKAKSRFERDVQFAEAQLQKAKERYERNVLEAENTLKHNEAQIELRKQKEDGHMKWVLERIKAVEERMNAVKASRTKEELALINEFQDIMARHTKLNPTYDVEIAFPDCKTLFLNAFAQPPAVSPQSEPPNPVIVPEKPKTLQYEPEPEPEEEEEDEMTKMETWNKMTAWERWVLSNPKLHADPYKMYHGAIANGITPGIPEPAPKMTPAVKKSDTHANKTVSRESLAKVIPGYN